MADKLYPEEHTRDDCREGADRLYPEERTRDDCREDAEEHVCMALKCACSVSWVRTPETFVKSQEFGGDWERKLAADS